MKTMFRDMIKSKTVVDEFVQSNGNNNVIGGVEFSIKILTSGHWPYSKTKEYSIPPQVYKVKDTFERYYQGKF